ncbi:hypothetical protein AB1Y20_023236 [Prymnesium parvum]|uniref:2OG-Fe dioxygenase family protein n=1 Tax=Prymnesium parvum TaxID=97485 RepID=A0AB34JG41_PRYPA
MSCAALANVTFPSIQAQLARDNYALITASDMRTLLSIDHLDVLPFSSLWDEAMPQKDEHGKEVYPYKGTLVSFYDIDVSLAHFDRPRRSKRRDYVDSSGESPLSGRAIEHIDPTTEHNASFFRLHKQWPTAVDDSPITAVLQRLIFEILARPSDLSSKLSESSQPSFEAMMTAFRVTRDNRPGRFERGEPGPEGIHQDSADLTIVMMMSRRNVAPGTGSNRVWSLEQPCGKPSEDDLLSGRLLASSTLVDQFDTLLLMDRYVKHEACAIVPEDGEAGAAVRDVLTFEVRRPQSLSQPA